MRDIRGNSWLARVSQGARSDLSAESQATNSIKDQRRRVIYARRLESVSVGERHKHSLQANTSHVFLKLFVLVLVLALERSKAFDRVRLALMGGSNTARMS